MWLTHVDHKWAGSSRTLEIDRERNAQFLAFSQRETVGLKVTER